MSEWSDGREQSGGLFPETEAYGVERKREVTLTHVFSCD